MSDNIRLAAQELFNVHIQPTSKQILVAVVLDSVREAMSKKSSSSFTLADAENFLGRENVESAPLFKDYVASIEELGSYVKNIDVSGFFSTDDEGRLHTYLDLSHSCVQNFYYVGMSPSWQDLAELLVIVRKTLTEEYKPITKEVMELVIGWMTKFMNSISRCLPADGWDDFLSQYPPPPPSPPTLPETSNTETVCGPFEDPAHVDSAVQPKDDDDDITELPDVNSPDKMVDRETDILQQAVNETIEQSVVAEENMHGYTCDVQTVSDRLQDDMTLSQVTTEKQDGGPDELRDALTQAITTFSAATITAEQCAVHDGCMPLVGCSCGAVEGPRYVLNSLTGEYYKNMSTCNVCRRYQCLHCGDEFRTRGICQVHILGTKTHKENTAIVTTEHSNRPLSTKMSAPQLDDNIALVPCGGQCPGTEEDAFKVHQYMTKCRICQQYKCSICMKKSKPRRVLETHITDDHGFDCHADIVESAILQHKKATASFQRKAAEPRLENIRLVPDGAMPLVGCSCGAPGGPEYFRNPHTRNLYTNMSKCSVCRRFQCLMCGDEFGTYITCQAHISNEQTHQDGTAVVTTEHRNRPLPAPVSPAPPLSDQIKLLPCVDDCPGSSDDAFKIHQYLSKCRKCWKYKCALCTYRTKLRNISERHVKEKHQLDFLEPVKQRAISENQKISINDILFKKFEEMLNKPPESKTVEKKPLVGCSCGAPNGPAYLLNTAGSKHHENISVCRVCKRYQCLHCGDEFPTIKSCVHHVSRDKSHQDGTVCVTTEHQNRPLPPPLSFAPPLSDQIKPLPCVDVCHGTAKDAFKVHQYISKCRLCEGYKCALCPYKSKHKGAVTQHTIHKHKLDYMKPVDEYAIKKNTELCIPTFR